MVIIVCDGCGKEGVGFTSEVGHISKPRDWYMRTTNVEKFRGAVYACSRECCDKINEITGEDRANLGSIFE